MNYLLWGIADVVSMIVLIALAWYHQNEGQKTWAKIAIAGAVLNAVAGAMQFYRFLTR